MALSVAPTNYTLIHSCETTTSGWTGTSAALVSDFAKAGNACIGFILRTSGNNDIYVSGSFNLSGTRHLRIWLMTSVFKELETFANGGVQFFVYDGTNTGYYTVGGRDTYPGGWMNYCVDLSRSVNEGTKPNMSAITRVGVRIKMWTAPKNAQNTWVDFFHLADNLTCSDTAAPFDLEDIYNADVAGGWGIVNKISGVYFLTGGLELSGFLDSAQAVVFEDRPVNSALYTLKAHGDFQLGTKVGSAGVSGLALRTQRLDQPVKFKLECAGALTDDFKIYGATIVDAGDLTLPADSETREILNTAFEACGKVAVSSCVVENCNFISSDATAAELPSGNVHKLKNSNFINNVNGVEIPNAGTYTFDGLVFTGNTNDIKNSSTGLVTANASGISNVSTYTNTNGGTTVINNTKQFTFIVKDTSGNNVTDYEWRLYEKDPTHGIIGEDLAGVENEESHTYSYNYNYTGDMSVVLQIIKTGFVESLTEYILGDSDQSVTVIISADTNI